MTFLNSIWIFSIAYFLGSIPTAVIFSKIFYRSDIRQYGSGNAGSTNMFRNFGVAAGIGTQLIDIGKAILATQIPVFMEKNFIDIQYLFTGSEVEMEVRQFTFGLVAIAGHVFPVFAGFRGGKGVNCLFGTMVVVNLPAALVCAGVFALVLFTTRYVSLGSLLGTLAFPAFVLISNIKNGKDIELVWPLIGLLTFLLISYTHRFNIKRLWLGRENKAGLFRKRTG